jgi:gamma-glutamyltranspeptidase/glutathione hydrolase
MKSPFDWGVGYPSQRQPVFGRNVVATSHPLAAQVGLRVLQQGGNAVDAAIATSAAMTIVEPVSNGLGSDAFAIVWDGERLHGLNASGRAPEAWTPTYFRSRYGEGSTAPPMRGWDSVTVPGAVASWVALSERLGRLPFADLMAPAIELAERGYAVPPIVQQKWAAAAPQLASQPGFAEAFMPNGRAPEVGERFCFPAAARSLRLIAESRGAAYYGGELAAAMAAHAKSNGGSVTVADFAAYRPEWVTPIARRYRDHVLHEIPPNGQGIAALIALGIAEKFDLGGLDPDGVESQHLLIEAMKLAFADVYRYVADPVGMTVSADELLDDAYLASRAAMIRRDRAQAFEAGTPNDPHRRGGTIYLTAADERGMMVSFIQSNYMGFGSGIVVPGYGLSMQNRGHGFRLDERSPNVVAPGKRPFHTIIPGFLMRADGTPQMSFGVMGGNMQPQGHLQTLSRMLDHRQSPQAACDGPRWRFNSGLEINVETAMPEATQRGLADLGHRIESFQDAYQDYGAGQFIWRLGDPSTDGYAGASDSRRDGLVAAS